MNRETFEEIIEVREGDTKMTYKKKITVAIKQQ